ncbi:MAG: ABC transporter permease [Eubacteriales bacterium]|nr:ABC transporter permease [Eubacteriales bacterium]
MNWWNRSLASLGFRWKKNLLLFLAIASAGTLLLPAWSMKQTAGTALTQARQEIPAYVNMMVSQGDWYSVDPDNYFSPELAEKIAALPQVKDVSHMTAINVYSRRIRGLALSGTAAYMATDSWKEPIMDPDWGEYWEGWVQIMGVSNLADYWDFRNGETRIIEGRGITEEDAGQYIMVMSRKVSSDNQIRLGEKADFQSYFDHDVRIELELAGVHDGKTWHGYSDSGSCANFIYAPIDVALQLYPGIMESRYGLNDPDDMEAFIEEAKKIAKESGEDVIFAGDSIHYLTTSSALKNAAKTGDAVTLCVLLMTGLIISLLVSWSMLERVREIGILLSMGEKRRALIAQFLAELLIPIGTGLVFSVLLGNLVTEPLGRLMMGNIPFTGAVAFGLNLKTIAALMGCGIFFTLVSMAAPLVSVFRMQPGKLLRMG